MEANTKRSCDFTVSLGGEDWHIKTVWLQEDRSPAWYVGSTCRNGVRFYRTFAPDKISHPKVKKMMEGYYVEDAQDI